MAQIQEIAPEDLEQCSDALQKAAAKAQRVRFVGGGTALGLGGPLTEVDVLLSTERLSAVVDYCPEDQVVVVQAGCTLDALQRVVGQRGQWLGADPPFAQRATLGGMVAVAASGPRRQRYGPLRDLLLGVTLVRADGKVARCGSKVVKNVAGFDLPKVLCGSLGTLGLIAEVVLRLHPAPRASCSVRLPKLTAREVAEWVLRVRQMQLEPSSLCVVGSPRAGELSLLLRFEGLEPAVERDAGRLSRAAAERAEQPAEVLSEAAEAAAWADASAPRESGDLRLQLAALPSDFPELVEALAELEEHAPLAFVAYPAVGTAFAALTPLDFPERLGYRLGRLREQLAVRGGHLAVEGCGAHDEMAALFQHVEPWGPPPSSLSVMRELKSRFDPERRLNPSRLVGGL